VPRVIASGHANDTAFLALEWLELGSAGSKADADLGRQLAATHRVTANRYGWHRDNWIGLTPQVNAWSISWVEFFREHRLGAQLRLARDNGFSGDLQTAGALLMKRLPVYFDTNDIPASLLHGDLWAGNRGTVNGRPVVFDPAVYYGDRETDIAMTRLFGGFGGDFYRAYEAEWPLPEGHEARRDLYQLYHVLNHLNLFGSAYYAQALRLITKLLEE
jgi:fructosamine-3-kinase